MSDQIIVTVSGIDKVGIVAKVTTVLAQNEVNIEDIKQTLMQGHFVMFMLCDIEKSLVKCGDEMGMEIWVQKKEIVDNMHKI